jgi:hypothetical protein
MEQLLAARPPRQTFAVTACRSAKKSPPPAAHWKMKTRTFNVMKNHGYEREHNGETFLAMSLAPQPSPSA